MLKAVYMPKGRAAEYGEYALNIYDGCPHSCYYCYVPAVRRITPEIFHSRTEPYRGILERTKKDAESGGLAGKTVHLCFTGDPYPAGADTGITREIIKTLKSGGAHIQLLTKNGMAATRDFDLLDYKDKFGVTLTVFSRQEAAALEPKAEAPSGRLNALECAKLHGIGTWVSFEPVIHTQDTLALLDIVIEHRLADTVKIGMLNHMVPPDPINWGVFGRVVEKKCQAAGQDYYIKQDLRAAMNKKEGAFHGSKSI